MTRQDIMIQAHTEARKLVATRRCSYREALSIGLRRAHNAAQATAIDVILAARAETPKFLWLRGL